jgi:hypothetical protein
MSTQLRVTRLTAIAKASGVIDYLNRASLRLRFNKGEVDPRILSGATTMGWLFDSQGTLRARPHNLLTFSEQFDNAAWFRSAEFVTITPNFAEAPNGTLTADRLVTSGGGTLAQNIVRNTYLTTLQPGETYTFSVWMRTTANGTTSNNFIRVSNNTDADGNGTAVTVTDSWQRFSIARTFTATSPGVRGSINYLQGTGVVRDILVWGSQLNQGELQPYYPTTGSAYFGPRLTYDLANLSADPGLLAEEARTNQIRNSTMQGAVAGTPGTLPTNWGLFLAGVTVQVLSTFVEDGINVTRLRISGTASGGSGGIRPESSATLIPATSGQTWTFSTYVRLVGQPIGLSAMSCNVAGFNSSAVQTEGFSTIISQSAASGAKIAAQRFSHTQAFSNASTAFVRPQILFTHTNGATVDFTIDIGLPQLELGASASSPIPTFGTALTRSADNLSMTDMSWYQQSGGVLYVDGIANSAGGLVGIDDGTNNNRARLGHTGTSSANVVLVSGGSALMNLTAAANSLPLGQYSKHSLRITANNHAWVQGGVVRATGVTGALPAQPNRLTIGFGQASPHGNSLIREIAFISDTSIPDSALQRMTR